MPSGRSMIVWILWALGGVAAFWFGFAAVWFLLLVLFLVFANLSSGERSSKSSSAYSVFNPGQRALPGDLSIAPYEALLRGRPENSRSPFDIDTSNIQHSTSVRSRYTGPPVPRNAHCPCGSGLKFKKCCAVATGRVELALEEPLSV